MTESVRPYEPGAPRQFDARLLIATCCEDNRRAARLMVARHGCTADLVEDGAAAVQKAERRWYDLILIDLNMPGMGGLEAARRIRGSCGASNSAPIVVMTEDASAPEPRGPEFNAVLPRPLQPGPVSAVFSRWLEHLLAAGELARTPPSAFQPQRVADLTQLAAEAPGGFEALLQGFLRYAEERVQGVCAALRERDLAAVRSHARALGGTARTYGAGRLAELAQDLETTGRESGAHALSGTLRQELARARDEARILLNIVGSSPLARET